MTAACPFSIAQDYAVEFLREAEAGSAQADIHVPIPFLPPFVQHRVALTFKLQYDVAESGRRHEQIRIEWNAGMSLLPNFAGTIRFRIDGANTRVLVEGAYRVPFGIIGGVFDRLIGGAIANASVHDLARRIAGYLEIRQQSWRTGVLARRGAM
jgi:hypothetical protein